MLTRQSRRHWKWINTCALLGVITLAFASHAGAQTVSLTLAPGSAIPTTIDVTSAIGNDSDGPTPVLVTGVAEAVLVTENDPVHGLIATSLAFTSSDLGFADTDFQLTIFVPIDISLVGIRGVFSGDALAPGVGVSAGTSEFDVAPLEILWTEGEIVALDPPGIPAANTVFPLQGTAVVTTSPNGASVNISVTIPVSSADTVTESGITVTTTLNGSITLIGEFTPPSVPVLDVRGLSALVAAMLCVGFAAVRVRRRSPGEIGG